MQQQDPKIVFLIEDSFDVGLAMEQIILFSVPECRLVWARTIEEARMRLCTLPACVMLVDVVLPDGNGLDFLWEARVIQPEARAIVMTGTPLPDYEARASDLGALRFLTKPVKPQIVVDCLREALGITDDPSSGRAFKGTLHDLTPMDVLQLKCMANATTTIRFSSEEHSGRVHFSHGEIIHAEIGAFSGQEALNSIVSFASGTVTEEPAEDVPRTLHQDWQTLLMTAAHAQDIRAATPEDVPEHQY
jgi:DNA-binding NarL/FixJ family response regulator